MAATNVRVLAPLFLLLCRVPRSPRYIRSDLMKAEKWTPGFAIAEAVLRWSITAKLRIDAERGGDGSDGYGASP